MKNNTERLKHGTIAWCEWRKEFLRYTGLKPKDYDLWIFTNEENRQIWLNTEKVNKLRIPNFEED